MPAFEFINVYLQVANDVGRCDLSVERVWFRELGLEGDAKIAHITPWASYSTETRIPSSLQATEPTRSSSSSAPRRQDALDLRARDHHISFTTATVYRSSAAGPAAARLLSDPFFRNDFNSLSAGRSTGTTKRRAESRELEKVSPEWKVH